MRAGTDSVAISRAMPPEPGGCVGRAVLLVAVRDEEGGWPDLRRTEHETRVPVNGAGTRRGESHTVELHLLVQPGPHRLPVGPRNRVTRQTSLVTDEILVDGWGAGRWP